MEEIDEGPHDIENPLGLIQELGGFSVSPSRCIYRVPKRLRQGKDDEAYTPQVVSIGPLHHGKEHLNGMEYHKRRYLERFLHRTQLKREDYERKIKGQADRLRNCYAEPIGHSMEDFLSIILVDAAFIIEFLFRISNLNLTHEDDYLFKEPWMCDDVWVDLRMLENQLPLFILEDLFDPEKYSYSADTSIISLSYDVFKTTFFREGTKEVSEGTSFPEVKHFVDLIRTSCLPSDLTDGKKVEIIRTPNITALHRAGVKLKKRKSTNNNLFDIQFAGGTLEIPRLEISDDTEVLIRNLVAFEQCHYDKERYICEYVILMDSFVNTPKDVELLVKYGIVENLLGDNSEVSTLINKLGKGVRINNNWFYFGEVIEKLNTHYKNPWNNWKANLRQNYLNTPWAIISVGAAVFLILLTITQTVCSIISIA